MSARQPARTRAPARPAPRARASEGEARPTCAGEETRSLAGCAAPVGLLVAEDREGELEEAEEVAPLAEGRGRRRAARAVRPAGLDELEACTRGWPREKCAARRGAGVSGAA